MHLIKVNLSNIIYLEQYDLIFECMEIRVLKGEPQCSMHLTKMIHLVLCIGEVPLHRDFYG